eukprot:g8857.t1
MIKPDTSQSLLSPAVLNRRSSVIRRVAGRKKSDELTQNVILGALTGVHWFCVTLLFPDLSTAVLNAPKGLIPRTPVAALRRSIPSFNPELKQIQSLMEQITFYLRIPQRKPWGSILSNTQEALKLTEDPIKILTGVPKGQSIEGEIGNGELVSKLEQLRRYVELEDPVKVQVQVGEVLDSVANLELLEAPGLPYLIPRSYDTEPRLIGRAIAEFVIQRSSDSNTFSLGNGTSVPEVQIEITLDGYSSPLSAGCFAKNVMSGGLTNRQLLADPDSIVLQSKTPDSSSSSLPLEILPIGEFEPLYKEPIDVQNGDVPVLPFSIYGSVSLSHSIDSEESSAVDQAFIFKFNRSTAGLGGLAFDEGKFSVIGYVTSGSEWLNEIRTGDVISKATLKSGSENLVLP